MYTFIIRIIHANLANPTKETKPATDDQIVVSRAVLTDRDFTIKYTNGETQESHTFTHQTKKDVLDYIELVVANLIADMFPFEFVQLDSLRFPTVQYSVAKLKSEEHRKLLVACVSMEMDGH